MKIPDSLPARPSPMGDAHGSAVPQTHGTESSSLSSGEGVVDMHQVQAYVKRAKLMMVDDDLAILRALERHLRGIGYDNVVMTTDATEAIPMLRREQPDLVLLDVVMPHINGLQLLRQIRSDARWQYLPVVIVTACSDPATRREALDSGCSDFLAKPIDRCELALRVRNVLVAKAFFDHVAHHADELAAELRRQADSLSTAQAAAELRYHVGKAETATEVLHNVGNALNSVNLGVNLLANAVRESKLLNLHRAVNLLREHDGNLPHFLREDERGRILPSYLLDATDALLQERAKMENELQVVRMHLEHINAVIATQQKYATLCSVFEEIALDELLNDVEELLGRSIAKQGVKVTRHYETIPAVWTDRQKLLQVLLNVVKNAVESINQAQATGSGRLEFRLGRQGDNRALIEITDNGVGIPEDNLVKIFMHGFTTKQNGHGFGLHSCANIIRELGGSMRAFSDGIGKGATLCLDLPFKQEES